MKRTARDFASLESPAVIHIATAEVARESGDGQGTSPARRSGWPAFRAYDGPGAIGMALPQEM